MSREQAQATMLRVLVLIAVVLAATAFVFGFFPGVEVYRGNEYVETRAVVEQPNWFLGILVLLLAPAAGIWRAPRIAYALLWPLWAIALSVIVFAATFKLEFIRTVSLWPDAVFGFLMFALLFLVIAVVPIACGVCWWITRDKPARVVLPVARLVLR
jgi:hypothetical protein